MADKIVRAAATVANFLVICTDVYPNPRGYNLSTPLLHILFHPHFERGPRKDSVIDFSLCHPDPVVLLENRFPSALRTPVSFMNDLENSTRDEDYMREALRLAGKAYEADEVPVGAVVVRAGR